MNLVRLGRFLPEHSNPVICRSLGAQDLGAFERFRAAFSPEDRRLFTFLNQRPFEELLDPKGFWVVRCLIRGEEIVGYAHLEKFSQPEKAHVAHLGIIVSSQVRGQGLTATPNTFELGG